MYASDMLGHIENALGILPPDEATLDQRETAAVLAIQSLVAGRRASMKRRTIGCWPRGTMPTI